MPKRPAEWPAPPPEALADARAQAIKAEREAERQAYLATLDPRQRADLDPQ